MVIGIFIEQGTPFIERFFERIAALSYPKSRLHVVGHMAVSKTTIKCLSPKPLCFISKFMTYFTGILHCIYFSPGKLFEVYKIKAKLKCHCPVCE